VAAVVSLAGLILHLTPLEWAVVALTIGFVIVAETINTVVEVAVDLVVEEYHVLAKLAKDISAAAVLIAALTSVLVGMLIFVPHLLELWP
jgi:diacylglycerol kinase